jgi:hypothetical protein
MTDIQARNKQRIIDLWNIFKGKRLPEAFADAVLMALKPDFEITGEIVDMSCCSSLIMDVGEGMIKPGEKSLFCWLRDNEGKRVHVSISKEHEHHFIQCDEWGPRTCVCGETEK